MAKKLSKLAKAKANPCSRYWRNKADKRWSERVREVGKCLVCGTTEKLQAHHLISRQILPLRHEWMNGLCLCPLHHKWCRKASPHRGPGPIFLYYLPVEQAGWILDQLERWEDMLKEPVDFKKRYEALVV